MKYLFLILLFSSSANAQLHLTPSFGINSDFKITGQALVGYQYRNAVIQSGVQRAGINGATLGGNAGFNIKGFTPYVGVWYKPGARSNVDRYKDSVLLTNVSRRITYLSAGLQYDNGPLFIDAGFVGSVMRINFGVKFIFE